MSDSLSRRGFLATVPAMSLMPLAAGGVVQSSAADHPDPDCGG